MMPDMDLDLMYCSPAGAAYERVGPFSTALRVGEFIDWYARAKEMGLKSSMMNEIVMLRRIQANNLMRREKNTGSEYAQILKRALERADPERSRVIAMSKRPRFPYNGCIWKAAYLRVQKCYSVHEYLSGLDA